MVWLVRHRPGSADSDNTAQSSLQSLLSFYLSEVASATQSQSVQSGAQQIDKQSQSQSDQSHVHHRLNRSALILFRM